MEKTDAIEGAERPSNRRARPKAERAMDLLILALAEAEEILEDEDERREERAEAA